MFKRIVLVLSIISLYSQSIFSMNSSSSSSSTSTNSKKNWLDKSDTELENEYLEGASLLDIKDVFETAPEMAKDCVRHLKDPDFYPAPEYRVLFLYGPSGSGKSTLARAIAQYAGWDLVFCTPSDFQMGDRNQAAEKLRKKIDEILSREKPTVLVIDEINQLLENAESKNHDNDATSKEIWTTIDRIFGNHKFFIIGTSNRIHKIPAQIKTRIKARSCEIAAPESLEKKLAIFIKKMNRSATRLPRESVSYVKDILQKNPDWTPRDYVELAFMAKVVFREKDKTTKPIFFTPQVLQEALRRTDKFEEDSQYYAREMTDEERQDLYQAQNVHTQLLIQRFQKHPAFGLRTPGLRGSDANLISELVLTEQQKRLIEENLDVEEIRKERHFMGEYR